MQSSADQLDEGPRPARLPTRFGRNTFANYASSITALAVGLLVTPVLVHGLGAERYGTWVLIGSSMSYFNLLQFGFATATVRYVAAARAQDDLDRVRRVIATSFVLLSAPGLAVLLAAPGLAFLLPKIFAIEPRVRDAAIILAILSATDLAIAVPADTFGAALAGFQRYDLMNVTTAGTAALQALAWTIILHTGGGLVELGVATLSISAASQVARYIGVRRLVGSEPPTRRHVDRSLFRPLFTMSGWVAISDIAGAVINRIDPIIVGLVVGVPAAGIYSVGAKLGSLVSRFSNPITMQFFPHASAIATSADLAELRRTLFLGTRLALAITAPIAVVVGVLAKPTLTVWVGPEFRQAGIVVGSLAATATIYAVTRIGTAILNATGHVRVPAWIDSFEALLNLSLSVFLGQAMGLGGVALATVIAASVSRLGLMLPYVCFRLKTTVHEVVRQLLRLLAAPLATASAIGVFFTSLHPTNVLEVMAIGASMAALYVLTLLVLGVSSSERREIVSVVRSRSLW